MSKNKVLDTALSLIDKYIQLNHKEIARKLYSETGYCDQDFNKFIAVITSGELLFTISRIGHMPRLAKNMALVIGPYQSR